MVMERTIRVIKPADRRGGADSTDIALLVSTSSKQQIDPWDRSKIAELYDRIRTDLGGPAPAAKDAADAGPSQARAS